MYIGGNGHTMFAARRAMRCHTRGRTLVDMSIAFNPGNVTVSAHNTQRLWTTSSQVKGAPVILVSRAKLVRGSVAGSQLGSLRTFGLGVCLINFALLSATAHDPTNLLTLRLACPSLSKTSWLLFTVPPRMHFHRRFTAHLPEGSRGGHH